jgi:hypothetical protein
MFLDARFWVLSRRLLPEDPKHTREVAAIGGHVGMVGAKGRLANRQPPPQLGPTSAFQIPKLSSRRCRSTGASPTPTSTGFAAGWTSTSIAPLRHDHHELLWRTA